MQRPRIQGDGLGGLAALMFGAMICMIATPALMLGGIGWLVLRGKKVAWIGALLAAGIGAALGALAVTATFYESTWSPPTTLACEVPAGFSHEWVYLVADPSASQDVAWSGHDLPFTSRHARVVVPRSGVVRVRSLAGLDSGEVRASLEGAGARGTTNVGFAALNAPPGFGSGRVIAFSFAPWPGREPQPPEDPAELAARITALEREP